MTDRAAPASGLSVYAMLAFVRRYAVLIIIVLLMIYMSLISDAFLTARNLLNILNQSTPLALIAAALTLVIIGGGFDLSTGAIFGVATVSAAWIAVNVDPILGLALAPFVGLALGVVNGVILDPSGPAIVALPPPPPDDDDDGSDPPSSPATEGGGGGGVVDPLLLLALFSGLARRRAAA